MENANSGPGWCQNLYGKRLVRTLAHFGLVIHFLEEGTFEDAKSELTDVLVGRTPQSSNPNEVGTHDYSRPPRAIIFGRAFSLEQIQEVRDTHATTAKEPVAWIVGDPSKALNGPPGPGYAQTAAESVKSALASWKNGGGAKDEIILY